MIEGPTIVESFFYKCSLVAQFAFDIEGLLGHSQYVNVVLHECERH